MPLTMAPWIGCQYGRHYGENNRFGFRLLVIGESHYATCRDPEPWFGLTTGVVGRRVNGENRQRFFTTMTKVLTEADDEDPEFSVWHEVAFYNYIQSFVQKAPTQNQWEEARYPFRTVLEYLQPDAVLVASIRTGNHLDQEHGPLLDRIASVVMHHPSSRIQTTAQRIEIFQGLRNTVQQGGH